MPILEAQQSPASRYANLHKFSSDETKRGGDAAKLRLRQTLSHALKLQRIMKGIAEDTELKPAERSSAARVWVDLCDQARILAGIGLPKSVPASNDPAAAPRKRKQGAAKTEASDGPSDGPA